MTNINWKIRIKSKKFWLALVPAFLLLVQTVATPFGYNWDITGLGVQLTAVVNAVFGLLALFGIVVDPTTSGAGDSDRVLSYTSKSKAEQIADLQAKVEELQHPGEDVTTDESGAKG